MLLNQLDLLKAIAAAVRAGDTATTRRLLAELAEHGVVLVLGCDLEGGAK